VDGKYYFILITKKEDIKMRVRVNPNSTVSIVVPEGKIQGLMIFQNSRGFWQAFKGRMRVAMASDLEKLESNLNKIYPRWKGFVDIQRWADIDETA
jgi:hypothetical protein